MDATAMSRTVYIHADYRILNFYQKLKRLIYLFYSLPSCYSRIIEILKTESSSSLLQYFYKAEMNGFQL